MFSNEDLIAEFDPETRIIHFTARKRIVFNSIEDGHQLSDFVKATLDKHLAGKRGYMITDYSKIAIEPILLNLYAREMKEIIDTYLYPGGIARYGMDITRITAKMGHAAYIGGNPNLFNTKEEALDYINNLIEIHQNSDFEPKPAKK